MRFWDTSAIVPLLGEDPASEAGRLEFGRDPQIVVSWATEVECVSALTRRERDGALDAVSLRLALDRLDRLSSEWIEVEPGQRIREVARRLLRLHPLRAADALQLAAALAASEDRPATLPLVTLDDRLVVAAEREGFVVVRPSAD